MEHSQYDEELGDSEYMVPLGGEGSGPMSPPRTANENEYTRPARRKPRPSLDEEQPSTMDPPQLQQRSAITPTNYAVRTPPVNYNENRLRQPVRNAQAIAFARSESGSSNDAMEMFTKSVGHGSTDSSDKSNNETLRKRLMFDGSIQNIPPPSSGLSQSYRANENYNGGGNSSQDGEIEQQLVIWNITVPLSLSR
jgi:hypothetical protein